MSRMTFYILDVFAESRYAGNQLAVFRRTEGLSDEEMQSITREINFSETTFVLSDEPGPDGYRVRIFTPGEEVPFAGHPTIGTAYVIQQEIIRKPVDSLTLSLKVGPIPVRFSYKDGMPELMWMRQRPPVTGKTADAASMAAAIGLGEKDIDTRFPIQEVSTGLPALIVPLKNLRALQQARTVREKYFELMAGFNAKGILMFCPESHDGKGELSARFFAELVGVPEDAATGSANGCLAGYLAMHKYFGSDEVDVRVEQGYEMGRPSLLHLRSKASAGNVEVQVGGKAVMIAKGEWS